MDGEETSQPVAALVRTEGAPKSVPPLIAFSQSNSSVSVGRAENNQIPLNDKKISKNHALLTLRTCKRKGAADGEVMRRVFIKDSSTFGTFVNGKALKKGEWTILQEGDAIGLRNPHGNPSNGEYRVAYQDAVSLVTAAIARGEAPVKAVPASGEPGLPSGKAPKQKLPVPRVKTEIAEAEAPSHKPRKADSAVKAEEALSPVSDAGSGAQEPRKAPMPAPVKAEVGEAPAEEPMSPLSEVSEVSAPDEEEKNAAASLPLPGMMPSMPGVPGAPLMMMPGMPMIPGMPFGLPMVPGAPGLPFVPPPGFPAPSSGPVPNAALPGSKAAGAKAASLAVAAKPVVMTIGAEFVGMLIGRGGEVVKQLSTESGARIEISKTETEGAKAGERTVYISGLQDAVDKAKKLIDDAIEKAKERTGQVNPNACTLKVPHELIGMLIGRGGETIKDLKKESGARIDIAKEADEEGSTDRQVHITGPPECVEFAKKMIEDMLGKSRESREGKDGQRKSGGRVIKVPTDMIGVLIGRGGETISKIQRESSARIEIHKDDREALDRQVTITGSADNIEKAIRAIDDVLDGAERAGKGSRRRRDHDSGGDEGALVPLDRKPSPVRDSSWLSEKVYIDEVEMPYRPNYLPDHEDGMPTDLEIFVRGLPKVCAERDLWEHLYRLGATDVKEILLLRRQKQSKGMAYVVFNRHDHAVIAKNKLQGTPASSIPCGGEVQTEEKQSLFVRFSESERCINGRSNVYGADMAVLLQGPRGRAMQEVREASGLKKVTLTGRSMKGYGQVDEDPRMHLVVYYDADGADDVVKAIEVWGKQLGEIHREIVDRSKGKGKGKGWPWMPPPHYFDGRAPMMPHPYGPPPPHLMHHPPHMGPAPEPAVEAPVLLVRRRILEAEDGKPPELSKEKVIEATSLRGRELRWQPWPEVGKFNGEWKVTPLRWGLRGELFVLLRHRESGETRVCAAEVQSPVEKWPVLHTNAASSSQPSARYKSFTFNEHLFVISIDRESGILKVFHVPDPSSSWNVAFETTLPEDPSERQDFPLSRRAKLCIFYAMDRTPYAVAVEPKAEEGDRIASVFRIADPAKAWTLCAERPALPPKVRLLMVYTKARSPNPTEFEASLFAIDANAGEMKVFQVPSDLEKPWNQISSLPFAGDTRLSCIYVPGKPEPLLMAGSPTEKMQKLCHLNLMEWRMHKQDERLPPPKAPVVEEKFSRPMSSLWPEGKDGRDPQSVVALPIDCTADLAVSRHTWVTMPVLPPGAEMHGPPIPPGHRPPFDYGPGPPPHFDGRGPPPPFMGGPPPPYRPPFERPPPGWLDARRPPFDMPPGARPPFEGGPPPHLPPFERPPGPFDARPPFEGGRPPFEAPPGDWFGGKGKGKGPPPGAPPGAAITDGAPADGAEGEGHRRRRHRHRRGEEGDGEGRKRRRAERAEAPEAEGALPMDAPPGDVQAPADAPPGDVQAPAATDGAEPERKRHRRRHKDPDKDRSKSREDGERKHRRRRRRGEGDDPGS